LFSKPVIAHLSASEISSAVSSEIKNLIFLKELSFQFFKQQSLILLIFTPIMKNPLLEIDLIRFYNKQRIKLFC